MPESKQIEQCKPGIPQTTPTTAPPFLLDIMISTSLPFSALSESKSWTFEMRNKQVPDRVPFFGFLFCCFVIAFRNNLQSDPKAGPKNDQTWTLFGPFSNDFWLSLRSPNWPKMVSRWPQNGPGGIVKRRHLEGLRKIGHNFVVLKEEKRCGVIVKQRHLEGLQTNWPN